MAKATAKAAAKAHRLYIDGKWVEGKEPLPLIDKYTGETFGTVPIASREMVDQAIEAADTAFPTYSRLPAHKRFRILEKTANLLDEHKEEIATIICREAGKAWKYSLGEVLRAVVTFHYYTE